MPLAAFPKCFLEALVTQGSMTVEHWITMASTLAVDGLELYWGFIPHSDKRRLRSLKDLLHSYNLAMPMMCYSPDFTRPEASQRREEVNKQKQVIEITAELGGSFCRVLSGQRRPGVSISDGVQMAAGCIGEMIPFAGAFGVTLVLENHYKDGLWDWPELAQRSDAFLELLHAIPRSPWFGVNYDPSNAILAGDDPIALLQEIKDQVVTMHASDRYFEGGSLEDLRRRNSDPEKGYAPFLKHGVIGQGLNNYDAIFAILKAEGFNGWISIEDGDDPTHGMEHLHLSVQFLRQKMAQHGLG